MNIFKNWIYFKYHCQLFWFVWFQASHARGSKNSHAKSSLAPYCKQIQIVRGPVHTNADSKVYGFVLPKTHQLIHVHTSTKDIRIRFYPLSRAFPNLYRFGGSDLRVSVDGRPKRIKTYTDSNESASVWTGPESTSYPNMNDNCTCNSLSVD